MASRRTPDSSSTPKPAATKPKKPVEAKTASAGAAATPADVTTPASPKRVAKPKVAKAAAAPARTQVSEETRRAMIAEAAYLRAERRGFAPGQEHEDWLAAEKEVDALLNANTGTGPQ
jgi:hypothetical protein